MKKTVTILLVGLIGLFGLVKSILADDIHDLKMELKTMQEQIQQLEVYREGEVVKMTNGPMLKLSGFSDISFTAEESDEIDSNSFVLGQFDLFMTSRLSDNISFLGETIFEFDKNETVIDLERVELKYNLKEWFAIKIGRMHTALGYWNTAYHHSTWLHTTVDRPILYNWEDEGGIMPVHIVGIDILGRKALGKFNINYTIGVGNGRGKTTTNIQNITDENDAKAINLLVRVTPDFIQGLEVGFNIYGDTIPVDNSSIPARDGEIDELILGGYLAYFGERIELLAELSNINHDDRVKDREYNTLGFYIQGSYRIQDLTPYYRLDRIDYGNGDPYYDYDYTKTTPTLTPKADITKQSIGVRWDLNTWHALKLEYSYSDVEESGRDAHTITANASFRF